ncbi:MAG: Panacea domain-containing protein [Gammaproteobacteria bacterium]
MIFGKKGHDSRAIANIFVDKARAAKRRLTIMPLVKYVYLAHGWTLGYTGKPLIRHKAQAWKFGPVIPEVYRAFASQFVISEKARPYDPEFGEFPDYKTKLNADEADIVSKVYERYSDLDAFALSELTHREGTPWDQCNKRNFAPIPDRVIEAYYKKLIKDLP